MATVEIRCPVGPKRLFSKLVMAGGTPHITNENLLEFACSDCAKTLRRRGLPVLRVLHRFNLIGELIESVTVEDAPEE